MSEDRELIQRHLAGDREAVAQLIRRHERMVFDLARQSMQAEALPRQAVIDRRAVKGPGSNQYTACVTPCSRPGRVPDATNT